MDINIRFWSKVDKSGECWVWTAGRTAAGYGMFHSNTSRAHLAHRYAFELANGPIPTGMHVRHTCDNPPCVRIDHLVIGTHADNMRDMSERKRAATGDRHGMRLHPDRRATGDKHGSHTHPESRHAATRSHDRETSQTAEATCSLSLSDNHHPTGMDT